jgi:hypothetical protein
VAIIGVAGSVVALASNLTPSNGGQAGVAGEIGYTIFAPDGSILLARQSNPTTAPGIVEAVAGSGIYVTERLFTDPFVGVVVWDRAATTVYAVEDVDILPLTSIPGVLAGAVPVLFTITDSITSLPIVNAAIQVFLQSDTTSANILALGFTNASGQVTMFVPPGTPLNAVVSKSGYNARTQSFTSFLVAGQSFALTLTSAFVSVVPGAVVVFDQLVDDRGAPLRDVPVIARINNRPVFVTSTGAMMTPDFVETATDVNGFWQIPMIPNALLTPAGTKYEFEVGKLEPRVRKTATVATSPAAQLFRDLVP